MFRRFTSAACTPVARTALPFAFAAPVAPAAMRLCSTGENNQGQAQRRNQNQNRGNNNNNNRRNNNQNQNNNNNNNQNNNRDGGDFVAAPRFDMVRPAAAKADGFKLRVLFAKNSVIINRYSQQHDRLPAGEKGPIDEKTGRPEGLFSQKKISTFLPTVYIARFIGVLEGSIDKCVLNSRMTKGTFEPVAGRPHTFVLKATSSGAQGSEDATEWSAEFGPGDAVMLHRFLVKALDANHGFTVLK